MAAGDGLEPAVAAALPAAMVKIAKERQKRRQQATKAVAKAREATADAAAKIAAIGHAAVLPSLPEPEQVAQALRGDFLGILREPDVQRAIRDALLKPGKHIGLLRAMLEFVAADTAREPTTQVTFINAVPRPPAPAAIDVSP